MKGIRRYQAFADDSKTPDQQARTFKTFCSPTFFFVKLDLLLKKIHPKLQGVDFFYIFVLFLCSLKYTSSIENCCDITERDESYYLALGTHYKLEPILSLVLKLRGAIYPLWYSFLNLFADNPVNLFYLNYKVLSVLLTLLVYIFLRSLKVTESTSCLTAFYYLISFANLYPTPKCIHFILLFMLTALILSNIFTFRNSKLFFVAFSFLIASYSTRNEYFYPFLLFVIIIFISSFKLIITSNKKNRLYGFITLISIIFSLVVCFFYGFPLTEENPGYFAFAQHIAYNWTILTKNDINAWNDFNYIMSLIFPSATSFFEAFKANNEFFIEHILLNLKNLILNVYFLTFFHHNILLPAADKLMTALESSLGFFLFLLALWKTKKNISAVNKINFESVIVYCTIMAIAVVSSIIIYPRYHVIAPLALAIIIFTGFTVDKCIVLKIKPYYLGLILLLVTPAVQASYYCGVPLWQEKAAPLEFIATVKAVQQIPALSENRLSDSEKEGVYNVLDLKAGVHYYLGSQFNSLSGWTGAEPFDRFISRNKLDIIIYDPQFKSRAYAYDPSFLEFFNNPLKFNFTVYKEIGQTKIFTQKDLLKKAGG